MRSGGIVVVLILVGIGGFLGWRWTPSDRAIGDWQAFRTGGGEFEDPDRWDVADPFVDAAACRGLSWLRKTPPDGCHVALLRSTDRNMEILLIHGKESELRPLFDEAQDRFEGGAVTYLPVNSLTTVDGVDLESRQAYIPSGPFGGSDMSFFLGSGSRNGQMLIITGGSEMSGFDMDVMYNLVNSIVCPSSAQ